MVRSSDGHGCLITRLPPLSGAATLLPRSSTTSATTPGKGRVHEPGLVGRTPGIGAIICVLVLVCFFVLLLGLCTLPSRRIFDKSYCAGISSPCFISARIAVGAV